MRIDGTETQIRRSKANGPGRRAFVSGKGKQNTKKAAVVSDDAGRTLWSGTICPGRMHDQTAVKSEGIGDLFVQPHGESPGRRGASGPGEGLSRAGDRPAEETRQERQP
nr:transposase family protein [Streptomyces noursei]